MRNAIYRRYVRLTVMLTAIGLMLLSLNASAFMQAGVDPAAKKPHRVEINLEPVPSAPTAQLIVDGGFETGGIPNTFWNPETSTNFGTPLCDVPSCGTGGGASPPRTGAFWAWFGGIPAPETATLGQTVNFPAGDPFKVLVFWMRIGTVSAPLTDVLNVRVDGTIVASFPEPAVAEAAYSVHSISLDAFASGVSHAILFEYIGPTSGTGSYVIDDVALLTRPTAADGNVTGRISDANGAAIAGAVVNLSGTQNRKFITDANGDYRFDNVETSGFYTVRPSQANYSFSPAEKSFSQLGNDTEATFMGVPVEDNNPLDTPEYFVRQHYLDFLGGREPDESGFNFWSNQMLACGSDAGCLESRRINVSAAFFRSIEFLKTGRLVDGLYRISYGRAPHYAEFIPDQQEVARGVVVGDPNWMRQLTANTQAFLDAWMRRAAFRGEFDGLTNAAFVDRLISRTGVDFSQSERDALVSGLAGNTLTRAEVLLRIAEDSRFESATRNESFVRMEYFGFMRRDPDAPGLAFWLEKLNRFGGNFEQAEMVKAFIVSSEYRNRFGR